ncbi:hypothetical protein C0993_012510 [Termitomyces sp. T159_Od127]|nr:hypothetical protein C0993_012510 [Termitomyces sp. T159_Od127]
MGAAMPVAMKAPAGGAKELASSAKKMSPTKPASKRRGCQAPRYEAVHIEQRQDMQVRERPRPHGGEDIPLGGAGEEGAGGGGEG